MYRPEGSCAVRGWITPPHLPDEAPTLLTAVRHVGSSLKQTELSSGRWVIARPYEHP